MRGRLSNCLALASCCSVISMPALAHSTGALGGFSSGFQHPVLGPDHLLAMLAVGIWGAQMGGRSIWELPVAFPMMMAVGGLIGMSGVYVPDVELGIAISVLVLGASIAFAWRPLEVMSLAIIAAFAFFHGYAHGVELPAAADPAAYAAGFVIATGLIHVVGIGIGLLADRFAKGRLVAWPGCRSGLRWDILPCGVTPMQCPRPSRWIWLGGAVAAVWALPILTAIFTPIADRMPFEVGLVQSLTSLDRSLALAGLGLAVGVMSRARLVAFVVLLAAMLLSFWSTPRLLLAFQAWHGMWSLIGLIGPLGLVVAGFALLLPQRAKAAALPLLAALAGFGLGISIEVNRPAADSVLGFAFGSMYCSMGIGLVAACAIAALRAERSAWEESG